MLLGKGVMINWANVKPEHRAVYDRWHCHEHMAGRVAIQGFLRGRRYIAHEARRDFLTMYEVANLEVLTGPDYLAKANQPSPLTLQTTPLVTDSIRGLSRVRASFGVGMGGCALTLRLDPRAGEEARLQGYLVEEALPKAASRHDITGAHFIVADCDACRMTPVERQARQTEFPNWIVLIEGGTFEAVEAVGAGELSDAHLNAHGAADGVARDTYALQFTQLSPALGA
jgi:hypothetical protein